MARIQTLYNRRAAACAFADGIGQHKAIFHNPCGMVAICDREDIPPTACGWNEITRRELDSVGMAHEA